MHNALHGAQTEGISNEDDEMAKILADIEQMENRIAASQSMLKSLQVKRSALKEKNSSLQSKKNLLILSRIKLETNLGSAKASLLTLQQRITQSVSDQRNIFRRKQNFALLKKSLLSISKNESSETEGASKSKTELASRVVSTLFGCEVVSHAILPERLLRNLDLANKIRQDPLSYCDFSTRIERPVELVLYPYTR